MRARRPRLKRALLTGRGAKKRRALATIGATLAKKNSADYAL